MNANIETAIMSLIGNDPRFQRAMTMLQGKTPTETLMQCVQKGIETLAAS